MITTPASLPRRHSLNLQISVNHQPEVAIIGAGPYGLSLAAHLRALGVEFRIFGIPMHSWRFQMPIGMSLKSDGFASNLHDPEHRLTLKRYCAEQGLAYADEGTPISLETFIAYGLAFQQRFVPIVEEHAVTGLALHDKVFTLTLDDGRQLWPRQVVLATGLNYSDQMPAALATLPAEYCSHSSACNDLTPFDKRDVTVIGGGASAIDIAALLHTAGVDVRLATRRPKLEFHLAPGRKPRSRWQRLTRPQSPLGPSLRSWIYSKAPLLFHALPLRTRVRIATNYLGPAGGWFTRDKVIGRVPLLLGQTLADARVQRGRVHLTFSGADGLSREVITDHVIAATGYTPDLRRITFLDTSLRARLKAINHAPALSSRFETSQPGLYVIGATAARSFGPVMRFACGAEFAAGRLSKTLADASRQKVSRSTRAARSVTD